MSTLFVASVLSIYGPVQLPLGISPGSLLRLPARSAPSSCRAVAFPQAGRHFQELGHGAVQYSTLY